jgi:hypothetical protein
MRRKRDERDVLLYTGYLSRLTLMPWKWKQHVSLKRRSCLREYTLSRDFFPPICGLFNIMQWVPEVKQPAR